MLWKSNESGVCGGRSRAQYLESTSVVLGDIVLRRPLVHLASMTAVIGVYRQPSQMQTSGPLHPLADCGLRRDSPLALSTEGLFPRVLARSEETPLAEEGLLLPPRLEGATDD